LDRHGERRAGNQERERASRRKRRISRGAAIVEDLKLVAAQIRDRLAILVLGDHANLDQPGDGAKHWVRRRRGNRGCLGRLLRGLLLRDYVDLRWRGDNLRLGLRTRGIGFIRIAVEL
jgi:hypothetical protein